MDEDRHNVEVSREVQRSLKVAKYQLGFKNVNEVIEFLLVKEGFL